METHLIMLLLSPFANSAYFSGVTAA